MKAMMLPWESVCVTLELVNALHPKEILENQAIGGIVLLVQRAAFVDLMVLSFHSSLLFGDLMRISVSEPLTLAPGGVDRNGSALLLGKARHDGQQELALAVEGSNVLFFKIELGTMLLQLADGGQAVNRVSGKSAD